MKINFFTGNKVEKKRENRENKKEKGKKEKGKKEVERG